MVLQDTFDVKFTSREVSAWGGLALLKRMLDGLGFKVAMQSWDLPQPGSNRGYAPEQLIEQMIVSIWCGAARFVHADITRLDSTLIRLFGWSKAAGHKAIVRLFQRFDQMSATRVQMSSYQWLFNKLGLGPITLDVDSSVLTRWGSQIEGGAKGYNPKNRGRASHHPLLAFCADWRLVANFWLRPGNTSSSNNVLAFLEATLANLGATTVGLFRADSGFYDKTIVAFLTERKINHIISSRLTQALQQAIVDRCQWQDVAPGLQISELRYQPHSWQVPQRLVVIRSTCSAKPVACQARRCRCLPTTLTYRVGAMGRC
jgi:Transposase DDE domain group 1